MKWNPRKAVARIGVLALAAGSLSLFGAATASAAQTAPAKVVDPTLQHAVNSGGSATQWSLLLPTNSHCSKDTSTGLYTVTSYIVPASVDPGTLTWTAGAPSTGFQLYDTTGTPYGPVNTAIGSGNLPQPPTFDYTLFSIDGSGGNANPLPAGTYNVGIACTTNTGTTDQYWNVQETFTANSSDPNGEVWAVVPNSSVPESPFAIALPIGAIIVIGAGVVVVRRRRDGIDVAAAA